MEPGRRVLLVDDEPDVLLGAGLWLKSAGFETISAGDGEAGVQSAVNNHPDAIVMDVCMPRKDGLAALAELKNRDDTCDIPIVMLSASLVDQQRTLDAGARFFLTKPYTGRQLIDAVNAAVTK